MKVADLIRDGILDGSGAPALFFCFLAEFYDAPELIGYKISFFSYSTYRVKSYLFEDIYMGPEFRKLGVGKKQSCVRFVLSWNPAITFYQALRATNLTA